MILDEIKSNSRIIRVENPQKIAEIYCYLIKYKPKLSSVSLSKIFRVSRRTIDRIKKPEKNDYGIKIILKIIDYLGCDNKLLDRFNDLIFLYNYERMADKTKRKYSKKFFDLIQDKEFINELINLEILSKYFFDNYKILTYDKEKYLKSKIKKFNDTIEILAKKSNNKKRKIQIIATNKSSSTIQKLAKDFNCPIYDITNKFDKFTDLTFNFTYNKG